MGDNQRKAKPTPADRAAAKRLKALWVARAPALKLSQEKFGAAHGMNQSSVSQYLNGRIPLGYRACLAFAKGLGVDIREIRSDLPELALVSPQERPQAVALPSPTESAPSVLRADLDALEFVLIGLAAALTLRQPVVGEALRNHMLRPSQHSGSPIIAELLAAVEKSLDLAPLLGAPDAAASRKKAHR